MTRGFGFIQEATATGAVRAANYVEAFEEDLAEVVTLTWVNDKFFIFFSAKSADAARGIVSEYFKQRKARFESQEF